jgi:hypothetical protein
MTISFVVLILVLNPESPTGFPSVLVRAAPASNSSTFANTYHGFWTSKR